MKMKAFLVSGLFVIAILTIFPYTTHSQLKPGEPVVFGVPTALGSIEGRDGWMAIQMAKDELNAKGGIQVGKTKHKIEVYPIDTREHEPGIPVHDSLTAAEKLILEKNPMPSCWVISVLRCCLLQWTLFQNINYLTSVLLQ